MNDEVPGELHLSHSALRNLNEKRVICLVDGQHYPPVTKWTLDEIEEHGAIIGGLVFLGGTEKVENAMEELGGEGYHVYMDGGSLLEPVREALDDRNPDVVIDLSDEPVLDYEKRFEIAAVVLEHGCAYLGADFTLTPPVQKNVLSKPSISLIGTGKRVGKTAVSIYIGRILKEMDAEPVIVCMGRGGPPEPQIISPEDTELDPDGLLEAAERGEHAASDHWEDAVLSRVTTVGCRRCGGGMAGNPFASNVIDGAQLTNDMDVRTVIMEGSGSTLPPVKTDARILTVGASQPLDNILRYLGPYRIETSDLVIITMCEEPMASDDKVEKIVRGINEIKPGVDIAMTIFRPNVLGDIEGKKVFLATTAPKGVIPGIKEHLEKNYGCSVKAVSTNLSDRATLREDLKDGIEKCDVLLTEIKAASIDLAVKTAKEHGLRTVFLNNEPIPVGGNVSDLRKSILKVFDLSKERNRGE